VTLDRYERRIAENVRCIINSFKLHFVLFHLLCKPIIVEFHIMRLLSYVSYVAEIIDHKNIGQCGVTVVVFTLGFELSHPRCHPPLSVIFTNSKDFFFSNPQMKPMRCCWMIRPSSCGCELLCVSNNHMR